MAQDGQGGVLYVVGDEIVTLFQGRESFGYSHKIDGGARAGAERKGGPVAAAANNLDDVAKELTLNFHLLQFSARLGENLGIQGADLDGSEIARIESLVMVGE